MASSYFLSSFIFLELALVVILFLNPAFSTPRRALDQRQSVLQSGFRVSLKHVDSGKNLTKFQRIQTGVERGRYRLQRLSAMASATISDSQVDAPIRSGNGVFLMDLAIGTPPPCQQCYHQPTPIFDPEKSSSFSNMSCENQLCNAQLSPTCECDVCQYYYEYGDDSTTEGVMATETFTFGNSKTSKVSIANIGFGCGNDNSGNELDQGAGLVGLGRGSLSLVSQLKQPIFSYCLTPFDDTPSGTLLMGSLAGANGCTNASNIKTTPLIKNPTQPTFYYLSLEGISVGNTFVPVNSDFENDGSGGVVIDCGTTLTYMFSSVFDGVKQALIAQMGLPVDDSGASGLDLCFTLQSTKEPPEPVLINYPTMVLHFKGADLELPPTNYIVRASADKICLAMADSGILGMGIIGNIQQQNFLVTHDLVKETISFVPTRCDQL
ncbi:hypothetical protein CIPAW_03G254200 [Carya illinoinensis]|uniref:Peptidase A1 domain-containing protein n=1 Tax=Carya illinoinensis TaxID=32201 RepID=A0A8T1R5B3_CARIL|nr:hypothetical protein CIPAW_03G254200 [Carya illinoinensis]